MIAPGDTLEISIVSLPELRQRAQVNLEGQISYPLLGSLSVAGLPLADIQSKLKNELTNKSVRNRSPDGTERVVYIYPEEVSVIIAEYRPIYVNGDVSKPGELPYRPKMTVRQAVALAGGIDVLRFRTRDPNLEEVDLRAESNLLRAEFMRQQVLVARLEAELNGQPEFSTSEDPAALESISDIQKAQGEQLKLALTDHDLEMKSLARALEQTRSQVDTLGRLQEQLTQNYQQQATEVARLRSSFERGLASVARIAEEQRALAFASERLLQTEAQLTLVKKGEEEQRRQLQKAEDQRRLKLMGELQEARTKLADVRARIRAVDDKLVYVGSLRSRLAADSTGKPRLQIFRKDSGTWQGREVDDDAELAPGDVIEVTLRQSPMMRAMP
jgi:polysaccharide export outer membrane protein